MIPTAVYRLCSNNIQQDWKNRLLLIEVILRETFGRLHLITSDMNSSNNCSGLYVSVSYSLDEHARINGTNETDCCIVKEM
jgi:hypothetical protein